MLVFYPLLAGTSFNGAANESYGYNELIKGKVD